MPKSSIEISTPISLRRCSDGITFCRSRISPVSVISSWIARCGTPYNDTAWWMCSTRSDRSNKRLGRLTATESEKPKLTSQALAWRAASRTAHSDSGTIRPVSSASGMKSPGGTSVPLRFQRISASTPTMRAARTSILGW